MKPSFPGWVRFTGLSWRAGIGGALTVGLLLTGVWPESARGCSSFFVSAGGEMILGNTLDWHTEEGLIFLNKRNVTKRGLSWFSGAPVWTSRYASLTINQWGRDFPSRGMNEAGLAFGEMTLSATQFPAADARGPMQNNQWAQYMLDTCATVEDVLLADQRVRIDTDQYHSHYLFADRNGHVLSMEWLNGRLVYHTGDTMPVAVLTNDTYDNLLSGYRADPRPLPGSSSLARFSRAAEMIAHYQPARDGSVASQVFAIIDSVQNPGWTKWKLAFDVRHARLMFQTFQNNEVRTVEMGRLDFSPASPVQMLDVNARVAGDATGAFVDYTAAANRDVVIIAAQRMNYGIDPPWLRDYYNYPATTSVLPDDRSISGMRDLVPGASTTLSAAPAHAAGARCRWQIDAGLGWRDLADGPAAEWGGTVFTGSTTATLEITGVSTGLDGAQIRCVATRDGVAAPSPASRLTVALPPWIPEVPITQAASAAPGGTTALTASARFVNGNPGYAYAWQRNGVDVPGAGGATLTLANLQPADSGLYVASVTGTATKRSEPAIVGLLTGAKLIGAGEIVGSDLAHPNGNVFDQVLLTGAAETVTADPGQITRTSFIDADGDIVQVEFSGPGTLSLVLDGATGRAPPECYHQPDVLYMKGHAGIVIVGATEQTNLSVFTVGRATAVDQSLFRADIDYDGVADLAFVAIASESGRCGGVRAGNAAFSAARGHTGLYAPGVAFDGPVYLGNVGAFDAARPVLVVGAASEVRITGGDLLQPNGEPVQVRGIGRLRFTAGSDSHGRALAAQTNRAVLQESGIDVTAQIVVNP